MIPHHAFGPASAAPVEMGGPHMDQPGLRAVPSLRYLQAVPAFTEHFYDSEDEGDESVDNGPTGGLTWDGRADRGTRPGEDPAAVAVRDGQQGCRPPSSPRCARRPTPTSSRRSSATTVFDHPDDAFDAAVEALGTFEQSAADFYPYSSRYDAFLAGKATLTAQELHGRALFEDPDQGQLRQLPSQRARQ